MIVEPTTPYEANVRNLHAELNVPYIPDGNTEKPRSIQISDTVYIRMEDSSAFWKGVVIARKPSPIKNSPLLIIREYCGDGRVAFHEDEFELKGNCYYEKVFTDGS